MRLILILTDNVQRRKKTCRRIWGLRIDWTVPNYTIRRCEVHLCFGEFHCFEARNCVRLMIKIIYHLKFLNLLSPCVYSRLGGLVVCPIPFQAENHGFKFYQTLNSSTHILFMGSIKLLVVSFSLEYGNKYELCKFPIGYLTINGNKLAKVISTKACQNRNN